MKLIVISHPENISKEAEHVQLLFKSGLEIFHLRKPDRSEEEFEGILRQLPPEFYKKIVIHSHYKLVEKYNLKGIHLPELLLKNAGEDPLKKILSAARKKRLTISSSFHSIEAIENLSFTLDYVFLSPVFNSISKKGYVSKISLEDVKSFLLKKRNTAVIALGGIDESNIKQVQHAGFDGAALLGAIWNNYEPASKFQVVKNCVDP